MVPALIADSECRNPRQEQELTSHCFLCHYVSFDVVGRGGEHLKKLI